MLATNCIGDHAGNRCLRPRPPAFTASAARKTSDCNDGRRATLRASGEDQNRAVMPSSELPGFASQVHAFMSPNLSQTRSLPVLQRSRGRAGIGLASDGHRHTRLARLFQQGCLKVRLPRPARDGEIDAVLINTSGGLTGGDELSVEIDLGEGAHATVTTPACERVYRSIGGEACVHHCLRVERHARLDWIPQETILYDRSRLRRRLDVRLAADAEVTLAEALLFGRTAAGESVNSGLLHDIWTVRRDGFLLFADATRISDPFDEAMACPTALNGCVAMASAVHVGSELEAKRDALRDTMTRFECTAAGASVTNGVLVVRMVAPDSRALRATLAAALACLREQRPLPRNWLC